MYCWGFDIAEVPFYYQPRRHGKTTTNLCKFAISYLKTLYYLWQIRNSNFSADYDSRAFNSIIPLQRYWQRKRYEIITNLAQKEVLSVDIGCGSSRIIQDLPRAVALDMDLKKLRFLRKTNRMLIKADIYMLPFKAGVFNEIICSEVIEHIPKDRLNLQEFRRVLPEGGILIIGTPDYATFWWNFFEWFYARILPNAYAEGHIAHYTKEELIRILKENSFEILSYHYICGAELIIKAKKR
jgi:ubiquinone/menaquinone biosynthesis C-methylase UbiE